MARFSDERFSAALSGLVRHRGPGAAGAGTPAVHTFQPAWARRYGSETLVLSPEFEMVKVPADCTAV